MAFCPHPRHCVRPRHRPHPRVPPGSAAPLPAKNEATRHDATDPEVLRYLEEYFAPHNEDLFELLGQRLWEGRSASV